MNCLKCNTKLNEEHMGNTAHYLECPSCGEVYSFFEYFSKKEKMITL